MEEYKKVWKEMENLGWSNIPEGFHLEYFKDIIEATKTALITSQKSDFISNVSMSDFDTEIRDTRTGEVIKPRGVTIRRT